MNTGNGSMAFMFETCYLMNLTEYSMNPLIKDDTYVPSSYGGLIKHFDPNCK